MSLKSRRRLAREPDEKKLNRRLVIGHRAVHLPQFQAKGVMDVFQVKIPLTEKVVILGSGINGVEHYPEMNGIGDIIACNQGAQVYLDYPKINKPKIWIVTDTRVPYRGYFDRIYAVYDGIKVFNNDIVLSQKMRGYGDKEPEKHFTFDIIPRIHHQRAFIATYSFFTNQCTVAGDALWLAYIMGNRHMVLCGVDMSGDIYFDGSRSTDKIHGDVWNTALRLDNQIEWMQDAGCQIYTISETKLKNPVRLNQ